MRHGQTDWNITWKLQGRADIPINANGRAQAEALRARLAGVRLDAAYVSSLCRAQQTAHILLRGTNVPLYTQPALAERDFGAYEGLRKEDFDFEAFWHPEVPCPAPGAEPAGAFYARVQGFLRVPFHFADADMYTISAHKLHGPKGRGPGAVLLVAHGGVSIPVQLFARGVQSLGPGGAYVPLIWPHGKVLHFTVPQEVGQKA